MKLNEPWEQLARYFAGELSAEENQKMQSWIKADPNRNEMVEKLQEIWKEAGDLPYQLDVDQAWIRLSDDIEKFEMRKKGTKKRKSAAGSAHDLSYYKKEENKFGRPGSGWRRALLVAATILIVVSAGLFSYQVQMNNETVKNAQVENQVFETEYGERATYILSDGSRVILHAGSRLEISAAYNRDIRELFLEGEAYFETVTDPEKPFVVHSKEAYTRVLGTRFLVQAWPETNNKVEVVVSEGKVAFGYNDKKGSDKNEEVFITQNKMAVLESGQRPVVTEVSDMNWYTGWTEGRLDFKNRPLREVLPRLERWYDIDIRVDDKQILEEKITAEIDYSQSMTEVLKGIALTLGLEIEKKNRTVTFLS